MPAYRAKLKRREVVAEGTMAFYFARPAGFQFKAGQSANYTLIDPPETDAEGDLRTFSIASAPFEQDLLVTTRMRDTAFKRVLRTLPVGREINVAGPFGSFTLDRDASQPSVFLAGGIGITPFRSILLQATKDDLPHRLFLFYANRRPEDTAFLDELQELEKQNPRFTLIATMTEMQGSQRTWAGNQGRIDKDAIQRYVGSLASPTYYLAGPPPMVRAMRSLLKASGVREDSTRYEEFGGY